MSLPCEATNGIGTLNFLSWTLRTEHTIIKATSHHYKQLCTQRFFDDENIVTAIVNSHSRWDHFHTLWHLVSLGRKNHRSLWRCGKPIKSLLLDYRTGLFRNRGLQSLRRPPTSSAIAETNDVLKLQCLSGVCSLLPFIS